MARAVWLRLALVARNAEYRIRKQAEDFKNSWRRRSDVDLEVSD